MEVLFKVPEDLSPYIEFIPAELLPDILSDLLRKAIFKPDERESSGNLGSLSITDLKTLLGEVTLVAGPANLQKSQEVQKEVSVSEHNKVVATPLLNAEDLADFGDFGDFLK